MAHPQQAEFVKKVKERFPERFTNCKVIDCGSWDVNGNNRWAFTDYTYTGIDIAPGNNVDLVSPIHEAQVEELADVVISTECLEHDMHYPASLQKMHEMLRPGGLLVITCATTGRPEHGTRRTSACSQTAKLEGEWSDYYKNLTEEDFRECLDFDDSFSEYEFEINPGPRDIYFWGIKK